VNEVTVNAPYDGSLVLHHSLDNGIRMETLIHSWGEMRWIAAYPYRLRERQFDRPKVVNEWKCYCDFDHGLLMPRFKVSMHIIFPEKLGQVRWLGLDISPGAKTYLEFLYERPEARIPIPDEDYWRGVRPEAYPEGIPGPFFLAEISKGARPPVDVRHLTFPGNEPGLVKPVEIDFPFPFEAQIDWRHGYHVPFLTSEGENEHLAIPNSLRRR